MKIFGLLAHPVSHSRSPELYRAWFTESGLLGARFDVFDVEPEGLSEFMQRVRNDKISGLAVSIPHKESVMKFLDEIDEVAEEIGAVNTIGWERKKLKGWNTDWIGVRESFKEAGVVVRGKRVLVLGAGGAARAVVYALMCGGAQVVITNRTFDSAEDLASTFRCSFVHWDDRETVQAEVVVNATSVGLDEPNESPVSAEFWKGREAGFDLVYEPKMTKFLREAQKAGVKIISGDRMLFLQGKEQFKLVTGKKLT